MKILTVLFCLYLIKDSLGFSIIDYIGEFNNDYSVNRTKRQAASPCKGRSFQCKDGNCIPRYQQCDGVANCPDLSDETIECRKINCPDLYARCSYGACIAADAECNGEQDCIDNSDENNPKCGSSVVSPPVTSGGTDCRRNQFKCNDQTCIARHLLCDGEKNCADGSDETQAACGNNKCPDFAYRCDYGACVSGDAKCNRKQECADNSDEDPVRCNYPTTPPTISNTPNSKYDCQIPDVHSAAKYEANIPRRGYMEVQSKSWVLDRTALRVTCRKSYVVVSENNYVDTFTYHCVDGKWSAKIRDCIQTCQSRVRIGVQISCIYNNQLKDCTQRQLEGTTAQMECKRFYVLRQRSNSYSPSTVCHDGTWSHDYPDCIPVCGVIPKTRTYAVNALDAFIENHPWHVGIYRQEDGVGPIKHKCGGSLINRKTIVSAAHCFSEAEEGKKYPENEFFVAAAKTYRDYNDPRDKHAKKSKVEKIIIHSDYRAYTRAFTHDIALVILKDSFEPTELIGNVCIDPGRAPNLFEFQHGTVVGWGHTQTGKVAGDPHLKRIVVPFLDKLECENTIPPDFKSFLVADKLCAGYRNGTSVCEGDSGGGLVTVDRGIHFLRGIVSNGPIKDDSCDNEQIALYTKVSDYLEFIFQNAEKYENQT